MLFFQLNYKKLKSSNKFYESKKKMRTMKIWLKLIKIIKN